MNQKNGLKLAVLLIIIATLTYLALAAGDGAGGIPSARDITMGIDIRGGVSTTLYPDVENLSEVTNEQIDTAVGIITVRLNAKGIYNGNIAPDYNNKRIVVEIPYTQGQSDTNPQKAVDELGQMAELTFQKIDEEKYDGYLANGNKNYLPTGDIVVQGDQIADAGVGIDPDDNSPTVTLKFDKDGTESFAQATKELKDVGKIGIFMDDELIIAPKVNSYIPDGEAYITGSYSATEAKELAAVIKAGALPYKMVAKELNSITSKLGESALATMVKAGIISIILVCLFMLFVFRLPGLLADIALIGLVMTELIVLSLTGLDLTLPGIAGIILTIGMGVDANVIIFARIKEELKTGKTLKASIDVGFKRAFTAIIDANVTTFIAAAVLYILGTGAIKGFAITLGLGVILSFFTAIIATRILLRTVSGFKFAKNKWLYGINVREVGQK